MLLERLMLLLIEQRIVTMSQLVDAVEDAIATKRQMVVEGEHPHISLLASGLLSSMRNSLAASRATCTRCPILKASAVRDVLIIGASVAGLTGAKAIWGAALLRPALVVDGGPSRAQWRSWKVTTSRHSRKASAVRRCCRA